MIKNPLRYPGTPLRYPGGKSRAIDLIMEQLPDGISEFREAMVGGGSVFLAVRYHRPNAHIWINDAHPAVFEFWQALWEDPYILQAEIQEAKDSWIKNGKLLYKWLISPECSLSKGAWFYIMNRITFSGTLESGGYSQAAFESRFTQSGIDRLGTISISDIRVTNLDYLQVLEQPGTDTFIFLDPPYYSNKKSRLYGKRGNLHREFNHDRLADALKQCPHRWLLTYDDCPEVQDLYQDFTIVPWQLQYGMNNGSGSCAKGNELFIRNYH